MNTGVENDIFWSEMGSGFVEPGGTPPPRIHRSNPRESFIKYTLVVINTFMSFQLVLFDKEYEVILKLFTVSTVCGISAAPSIY